MVKLQLRFPIRDKKITILEKTNMVYKVYYQESMERNPKREYTQSFYLEADNQADAYAMAQKNTDYNIETVEELSDAALVYEQADLEFKLTTFN